MVSRADRAPAREVERSDPDYPAALLELADPPERLFVRGPARLEAPAVALVGSRAATPYGLAIAARLGADLTRLGFHVVSGLAHGIDAAAHRGALEAGGATLAILPGGLEAIVPRGHGRLAEAIAPRGALVSEHPAGTPAWKSSFLARNRLIAALARAVVVVEAGIPSGALNTAAHARRLGRPLLAVPGDVDRASSRGCHALLREGASICEGVADVLAAIGGGVAAPPAPPLAAPAPDSGPRPESSSAARLLATLTSRPESLERCAERAGIGIGEAQAAMLELEWAGLARAVPGGCWLRRGERP